MMLTYFRKPLLSDAELFVLNTKLRTALSGVSVSETESVFYVETSRDLSLTEYDRLHWLLMRQREPHYFSTESFLGSNEQVFEVGPRLNFETAESTNAVTICRACGIPSINRIEVARRYQLSSARILSEKDRTTIYSLIHDKMTECAYIEPLTAFKLDKQPELVKTIPVLEGGTNALWEANKTYGLGFDEQDVRYYYHLFVEVLKRDPTDVELFDLGQKNSEHSRHHFFGGRLIIDEQEVPYTLFDLIKGTLRYLDNSVIAFHDNASAIRGFSTKRLVPRQPGFPSALSMRKILAHLVLTCETHNHPCLWAPYPGAATGSGGRRRDNQATGRGARVVSAAAGFSGGNLYLPDYTLDWEDPSFRYNSNTSSPLNFFIQATNGAFDDGNQFGEPVILGFTRSFGLRIDNQRWEYVKPIMFSGGFGQLDDRHTKKGQPENGALVVKIGGLAYCVGVGGGSGSSMMQGENSADLDLNSVQRADGEMAQKTDRVIDACIDLGNDNPIISNHDQGAGGNSNVLSELLVPAGGRINIRDIPLGDQTMSVLEIWSAEYQEGLAILISPKKWDILKRICERENVPHAIVGHVSGDGRITVYDKLDDSTPVDFDLKQVLSEFPQKTFTDTRAIPKLPPLTIPDGLTVEHALGLTLRLLSVGSKQWLTNKVDRGVTGLVAQQQCVGPLQLPLSDYSISAQSHFGFTGQADSIGEQPIKGLISPQAMARMTVAEALTNLMFAPITSLQDVKCSGNWMLAAKLPGGGAWMYDAAVALNEFRAMIDIDGGKDSLSLAAQVPLLNGGTETVRSPSTLVITTYVGCRDFRKKVTPDIKRPGDSKLMLLNISPGKSRLGGSALAQCLKQVGNETPDIDHPEFLVGVFNAVQEMLERKLILAGHDRSDGGLIQSLLEMAFAGNSGLDIALDEQSHSSALEILFSEESGVVIEYLPEHESTIFDVLSQYDVAPCASIIGSSICEQRIRLTYVQQVVLDEDMRILRDVWQETSYHIERQQSTRPCIDSERRVNFDRSGASYHTTFDPMSIVPVTRDYEGKPKVAILREEGSNGDDEMKSAFYMAGFEPWDITMTDLAEGRVSLTPFRGAAFVGGFSYKDVLDAAKGWTSVIRFNDRISKELNAFNERPDTFSLGVCNGCQVLALLGWVPWKMQSHLQPVFVRNSSNRFESRFASVKILESPSIMLRGMEGSVLGVPVAHGEGRLLVPSTQLLDRIVEKGLAPIRFVDDSGTFTEQYPFNPNGSPLGICALTNHDGRHLVFMNHPERVFLPWQWHYWPDQWHSITTSPWLKLFRNAYEWCTNNSK